ncbi:hypothetical protein PG999_001351 [Apiospora kogelbergensis]|uniref:Uncharacterized protein n=1 Tax=Apiospora kogelbergensis TaxID=1337665 RepID=A0AAW0REF5_9PEZI
MNEPSSSINTPAKLSKNWRKALDAVRDLVPTTATDPRPPSRRKLLRRNTFTKPTGQQVAQAANFTRNLNHAVFDYRNGWTTRHHKRRRYRRVKVLLTYWADTDDPAFGADRAARALAGVFRRRYGFDVLVWLIPVMQPQQALSAKLRQFAGGDDGGQQQQGDDLLIFWYGGSAREERGRGRGSVVWFGESVGGPTIDSQIVPQILGASGADLLTLYDSPHALHGYNVTGSGVCEHLGACAHDGFVAGFIDGDGGGSVPLSFTRALIRILDSPRRAAKGISVLDLHRKLVNRYHVATSAGASAAIIAWIESSTESSLGKEESQKRANRQRQIVGEAEYLRTQPWLPDSMRQTPVYCHLSRYRPLSEGGSPATIVVSQLGRNPQQEALMRLEGIEWDGGPLSEGEAEKEIDEDDAIDVTVRMRMRCPVDMTNIGQWRDWILDAPREARQVVLLQAKPK